MAKGWNIFLECQLQYNLSFASVAIFVTIVRNMATCETKPIHLRSMMVTLIKMQTPFGMNMISTCWHEKWRESDMWTCVCLCETWDPRFLIKSSITKMLSFVFPWGKHNITHEAKCFCFMGSIVLSPMGILQKVYLDQVYGVATNVMC